VIASLRDGSPVGAWLLKARPDVWDVHGALRSATPITSWPMAVTYRVNLVAPGQPCGLWITAGGPGHPPAGLYATGWITSAPVEDPESERRARWIVGVSLAALAHPVLKGELDHHPAWGEEEARRAPRVSTPVAVSPEAWAAALALADVTPLDRRR